MNQKYELEQKIKQEKLKARINFTLLGGK